MLQQEQLNHAGSLVISKRSQARWNESSKHYQPITSTTMNVHLVPVAASIRPSSHRLRSAQTGTPPLASVPPWLSPLLPLARSLKPYAASAPGELADCFRSVIRAVCRMRSDPSLRLQWSERSLTQQHLQRQEEGEVLTRTSRSIQRRSRGRCICAHKAQ